MGEPTETQQWGSGVQFSTPRLHRLEFEYLGDEPGLEPGAADVTEEHQVPGEFILGFTRPAKLRLGIEFGLRVSLPAQVRAEAIYRAIFRLKPDSPEATDPELAFRGVAARLAPTIVYPFLRELLTSLSQRALMEGFTLPVVQFGTVFSPDEMEIPTYEVSVAADSGPDCDVDH